jgi:hypothetical protein
VWPVRERTEPARRGQVVLEVHPAADYPPRSTPLPEPVLDSSQARACA